MITENQSPALSSRRSGKLGCVYTSLSPSERKQPVPTQSALEAAPAPTPAPPQQRYADSNSGGGAGGPRDPGHLRE